MKSSILHKIFLLVGLWLCAASCADDDWERITEHGVDTGRLVEVGIPFRLSKSFSAEIITRAPEVAENQTGKDSQLSGIMVFVFENKGDALGTSEKLLQFKLFANPDMTVEGETNKYVIPNPANPTQGHFTLYLPVGDVYIYLVGNAKSSFVHNIFAGFQSTSVNDLQTRREFIEKVIPKWTGNMYAIDGFLPMAGKVDNATGACRVEIDLSHPGGDKGVIKYTDRQGNLQQIGGLPISSANSFILSRIMSKVSMEFISDPANPQLKFTPLTYKFYHCPVVIPPVEDFRGASIYGDSLRDTETVPFDAQSPNSFMVYLPENIRKYTGGRTLTFKDRDRVQKDPSGLNRYETEKGHEKHYLFEHAPQKSTYVEITGHLENGSHSADVRYLIHLGDFSKNNFNQFSLERDWHYHYKVTVKGAKDILVEVLGPQGDGVNPHEQNPAVEGVVFTGGARVQLDAHYEQVEMKFHQSQFANGVYLYGDTPFGKVHCKYLPQNKTLDPTYPNVPATKAEVLKLLNWVEFKKQVGKGFLARYFNRAGETRMNVFELLDHVMAHPANSGYYTCFVDEYYYNQHPMGGVLQLSDFVNAPDRTFSIGSKISYSADKMSAVSESVYMLQQSSIATFYDLSDTHTAKYGVELVDEIGRLPYGKPLAGGTDVKYGRENCRQEIQNVKQAVNWEKNGYLLDANDQKYVLGENKNRLLTASQVAHLACLGRNRDFDGNGLVTPDELRWYTPARDQVFGLWIGEPAMPKSAALYPFNTSTLQSDSRVCQYPIFTSTSGNNRVVWGEQGCSYGDEGSAVNGGYVRVIRNLGRGDFSLPQDTSFRMKAEPYYEYNPTNRTIKLFLTQNALRAYTSRELSPHHERSLANRPYKMFQIAKEPYRTNAVAKCSGHFLVGKYEDKPFKKMETTPVRAAKDQSTTLAARYQGSGEAAVSSATWRLPNQREMLLMVVAMGSDLGFSKADREFCVVNYKCKMGLTHQWNPVYNYIFHCRTSFSNKNYHPSGFMFNVAEQKIQTMFNTGGAGPEGNGGYFCVRDVLQQ